MTRQPELIHVYPVGDLREHDMNADCWCRPRIDEDICIHNALDRREHSEGRGKPDA